MVLEDDLKFFPAYNASVVVREDLFSAHPELADVMQPISDALSNDVLIQLEWMQQQGFVF